MVSLLIRCAENLLCFDVDVSRIMHLFAAFNCRSAFWRDDICSRRHHRQHRK